MRRAAALSGGGAHGAWQSGVLQALEEAGLSFDLAWGFSAGALNAAAYALGKTAEASGLWASLGGHGVLRLSTRYLREKAVFTPEPMRRLIAGFFDEPTARARQRCSLRLVAFEADLREPVTAAFEPQGRWDAPLVEFLVASCSNPWMHPPVRAEVRGRAMRLLDGGIPGERGPDLSGLGDCDEILVVSVVGLDEDVGFCLDPVRRWNRKMKSVIRWQMERAAATVRGPELRWLTPSRPLEPFMFNFDDRKSRAHLELGRRDAEAYLRSYLKGPKVP